MIESVKIYLYIYLSLFLSLYWSWRSLLIIAIMYLTLYLDF